MLLHKDYGVNPTMPICIICKEPTGEIALLGAQYKGEAPKHMVIGIEPCEACKKKYLKTGVLLVEVEKVWKKTSDKQEEIANGTLAVIKDKAFIVIFNAPIPPMRIAKVEAGLLKKIGAVK